MRCSSGDAADRRASGAAPRPRPQPGGARPAPRRPRTRARSTPARPSAWSRAVPVKVTTAPQSGAHHPVAWPGRTGSGGSSSASQSWPARRGSIGDGSGHRRQAYEDSALSRGRADPGAWPHRARALGRVARVPPLRPWRSRRRARRATATTRTTRRPAAAARRPAVAPPVARWRRVGGRRRPPGAEGSPRSASPRRRDGCSSGAGRGDALARRRRRCRLGGFDDRGRRAPVAARTAAPARHPTPSGRGHRDRASVAARWFERPVGGRTPRPAPACCPQPTGYSSPCGAVDGADESTWCWPTAASTAGPRRGGRPRRPASPSSTSPPTARRRRSSTMTGAERRGASTRSPSAPRPRAAGPTVGRPGWSSLDAPAPTSRRTTTSCRGLIETDTPGAAERRRRGARRREAHRAVISGRHRREPTATARASPADRPARQSADQLIDARPGRARLARRCTARTSTRTSAVAGIAGGAAVEVVAPAARPLQAGDPGRRRHRRPCDGTARTSSMSAASVAVLRQETVPGDVVTLDVQPR